MAQDFQCLAGTADAAGAAEIVGGTAAGTAAAVAFRTHPLVVDFVTAAACCVAIHD